LPSRIHFVLLISALLCGGCNELNPPRPKPRVVIWKQMESWSGRGSSQTGTFDMGMAQWRVKWQTTNQTPGEKGKFVMTVNSGVSGRPLAQLVDHEGTGEGYGYVNDDPRSYYLVIDSNNLDWTVSVEQSIMTGGN
jgi:hypothetical protein